MEDNVAVPSVLVAVALAAVGAVGLLAAPVALMLVDAVRRAIVAARGRPHPCRPLPDRRAAWCARPEVRAAAPLSVTAPPAPAVSGPSAAGAGTPRVP